MDRVCNLIWLDDVHDPITAAMLYGADVEDGILSARRERERGVTPSFEVTMSHPGWALYAPTNKRAAALVIHTDGTLATAVVKARGWLRDLPSTMTGDEITLIFECRRDDEDDHDAAKEDAARAVVMADIARPRPFNFPGDGTARATPFRDLLFGRLQKLSDEVLQGRSAWWRYDAVTHEITLREARAPARKRHNIGDGYDNLQTSPGEGAVSEIRWRLVANIQQQASGTTNFGPLMGSISSLVGYNVQAPRNLGTNFGWSFNSSAAVVEHVVSETGWFNTGRSWQYEQRKIYYVKSRSSSGAEVFNTSYGARFTYSTDEQFKVRRNDYTFLTFPATYSYNQTRREVLDLVLRVPCQQAGGIRRTIDLGETSIGSLYTPVIDTIADEDDDDPTQIPAEMQDGGQYQAGDYAYYGDTLYRARRDNPGQLYTTSFKRGDLVTTVSDGWAAVGVLSPIRDRSVATFWPSPRGKACAAHAFRRMAAQAIARLYSWGATLTVQREYLDDVELEDEIAFLVPGRWDEPMKPVLGEITKVEDSWDGDAGDTVTVTVKVATGTGLNDEADVTRMSLGDFDADDFEAAGFEIETAYTTDSDLVAFAVSMGPLDQRVDVRRLADPTYALRQIEFTGSAEEQLAECIARAGANQEPVAGNVSTPTSVALGLVSLAAVPTIERRGTAVGDLLYSPRGIVL